MSAQGKWRPENDLEWQHAKRIADVVLDRINADPDDDIAVLARQLIRKAERIETSAKDAAAHNAQCEAEPVAWQWGYLGDKRKFAGYATEPQSGSDIWCRPLYTAPPPPASAVAKVEELRKKYADDLALYLSYGGPSLGGETVVKNKLAAADEIIRVLKEAGL